MIITANRFGYRSRYLLLLYGLKKTELIKDTENSFESILTFGALFIKLPCRILSVTC
ncbi:MAG: hypothetical protein JWO06_1544 [Bacteroidota bacterium]|nr:hypothetical protein [Bacteroidota bacterium]